MAAYVSRLLCNCTLVYLPGPRKTAHCVTTSGTMSVAGRQHAPAQGTKQKKASFIHQHYNYNKTLQHNPVGVR